jgi:hypothetical protein
MRKTAICLLILLLAVSTGGIGIGTKRDLASSYDILLLGDLHYDDKECRQDIEHLPDNRKKELERNLSLWQKESGPIPAMLLEAGGLTKKTTFGVQLGDIIQGDCGAGKLHKKSLTSVLEMLKCHLQPNSKDWHLFAIKGNHDIRGKGATQAFNSVMLPYLEDQFGQKCPVKWRADFILMHKGDLYVFFDSINADLRFAENALKEHTDARHVFFLTHLPVLPASTGSKPFWVVFEKNAKYRRRLLDALASRNAIVLTAHIHATTLLNYASEKGTVTQFSSFSMPSKWEGTRKFSVSDGMTQLKMAMDKAGQENPDLLKDFRNNLSNYKVFSPKASYNVLHVTPTEVNVERYAFPGQNTQTIKLK